MIHHTDPPAVPRPPSRPSPTKPAFPESDSPASLLLMALTGAAVTAWFALLLAPWERFGFALGATVVGLLVLLVEARKG